MDVANCPQRIPLCSDGCCAGAVTARSSLKVDGRKGEKEMSRFVVGMVEGIKEPPAAGNW